MFIAALFTIAKIWKQPKCPSTDKWIKKVVYIYNGILLSHKKEGNFAICNNMDRLGGYYVKWISQIKKDKYLWHHLRVESKKYNKLVNITKKKQTHRYREQTSGY